MNIDAGTMSPLEHGEVFVLDDGGEADLDLGNYERYLNATLTRRHNITTGKVYQHVIERERRGDYLGKTVKLFLTLQTLFRTGSKKSQRFLLILLVKLPMFVSLNLVVLSAILNLLHLLRLFVSFSSVLVLKTLP